MGQHRHPEYVAGCYRCDLSRGENGVEPPYYEITVRLPEHLYDEHWFDRVADAAGDYAAVSGSITPACQDRTETSTVAADGS